VYLDRGRRPGCLDVAACRPGCICQRYVEVGTCVFLKYLRNNGSFRTMPRAFCEAGVGVERLAFAAAGLGNIHQLKPLRDVAVFMIENGLLAKSDGKESIRRANICSDHLRGAVFAIADGARPGGNGRDHLLRTLIRRFLVRCDRQSLFSMRWVRKPANSTGGADNVLSRGTLMQQAGNTSSEPAGSRSHPSAAVRASWQRNA
jgi:alanyl-tRNA synthetase